MPLPPKCCLKVCATTPSLYLLFLFKGRDSIHYRSVFELAVFLEDDLGLLVFFPSARITGLVNAVLGMETRALCMFGKHAAN